MLLLATSKFVGLYDFIRHYVHFVFLPYLLPWGTKRKKVQDVQVLKMCWS